MALPGFDNALRLVVIQAEVGVDDGAADPAGFDFGLGGELPDDGEGEFVFVRAERAELVAELFREHRDGAVDKVDAGAALAGLLVDGSAGLDVPADVGDVHADLVVAIGQGLEGERVVKVLGVGRVDGEGKGVAEVGAALELGLADLLGDGVGGILHLFFEAPGQVELGEDGVHLGVVLAREAEHLGDVALGGVVAPAPAVHDGGNLHAALCSQRGSLFGIHLYVVGHVLGLHQHPGLGAHGVENPDEGPAAAAHYLDYLAFALAGAVLAESALSCAGGCPCGQVFGDGDFNDVAVERVARFGGLYVDVVVLSLDAHEDVAFASHLHFAFVYRRRALAAFILLFTHSYTKIRI